jgi:hypothetical protein
MDIHSKTHFQKKSGTFRFAFQNVGHFAASSADPLARIALNQLQFDCWALAGTNFRWQHDIGGKVAQSM